MREHRRQTREMFVPLSHPPGHAQCDFGEALVIIGGVEQKAHCFVIDLPHSDGCFVKAYPAEPRTIAKSFKQATAVLSLSKDGSSESVRGSIGGVLSPRIVKL